MYIHATNISILCLVSFSDALAYCTDLFLGTQSNMHFIVKDCTSTLDFGSPLTF